VLGLEINPRGRRVRYRARWVPQFFANSPAARLRHYNYIISRRPQMSDFNIIIYNMSPVIVVRALTVSRRGRHPPSRDFEYGILYAPQLLPSSSGRRLKTPGPWSWYLLHDHAASAHGRRIRR